MKGYRKYFGKKLLWFVITLVVAVILNFVLPRLMPADPVSAITGKMAQGMTDASAVQEIYKRYEAEFDQKDEALSAACTKLGGVPGGKGDVAYRIPMFPFLDVMLQYWDSDDEFPASLQLFVDDRMIDFMHYETVWFALSHMMERIKELMAE